MKYHLIGIGGIGMSGVARLLRARGDVVTGSDLKESGMTKELRGEGIPVVIGHQPVTIQKYQPEIIIHSSAISPWSPGNVEVEEGKKLGIPVKKRGEIIRELMKSKSGVAVSGMHGKTTTAGMLGLIALEAGLDPTLLVGGVVNGLNTNARMGDGKQFIVEACEYDGMFLELDYDRAIITNIEPEHMEYFKTLENIIGNFRKFVEKIPKEGLLVACGDNQNVKKVIDSAVSRVITYGFDKNNQVVIENVKASDRTVSFRVKGKDLDEEYSIQVPGKHNVLNACAAILIAKDLGISRDKISQGLKKFSGTKRRMEIYDEIEGVLVMDDYAHHPTEIAATLEALREFYRDRRIITVFRPSQYSRNKALLAEYGRSFAGADEVLVLTTYEPAGRDREEREVDSEAIVREINLNGVKAKYLAEFQDITDYLREAVRDNDLIITMGLGPLYELTKEIVKTLKGKK